MQDLFNTSQWLSSPTAYWTIKYEYQRSGADMQYRFYWKVWLKNSEAWFYDGLKLKLFLNGAETAITVKESNTTQKGWSYDGTTGWMTVANKASGTVPFYAELYDTNTGKTRATSASYHLSVSPSSATITSATDFTDEENPTIQYSNPAGNNVGALEACISLTGAVDDVKYRSIPKTGTSYTFNLTDAERKVLRSATTGNSRKVTFFLKTTISSVVYFSTITKTMRIVNGNPAFTANEISYTDANTTVANITGNPLHIVQNQSTLSVTVGQATAKKEAQISKYDITVNGVTKTVTASGTVSFGKINTSSNCEISVTVMDSRGNKTTAKKTVTVLPWSPPIITATIERVNNYEDETNITVNATIASVNGKNSVLLAFAYKESGGSYGSTMAVANGAKFSLNLNKEKAYVFIFYANDKFTSVSKEFPLGRGKFPLFIDTQKNAVGINDFPAEGEALRVAEGVARFNDGIVLCSGANSFLITVTDNGTLNITKMA